MKDYEDYTPEEIQNMNLTECEALFLNSYERLRNILHPMIATSPMLVGVAVLTSELFTLLSAAEDQLSRDEYESLKIPVRNLWENLENT